MDIIMYIKGGEYLGPTFSLDVKGGESLGVVVAIRPKGGDCWHYDTGVFLDGNSDERSQCSMTTTKNYRSD